MFISTIPFKVCVNHDNLFGDFISKISTDFASIWQNADTAINKNAIKLNTFFILFLFLNRPAEFSNFTA